MLHTLHVHMDCSKKRPQYYSGVAVAANLLFFRFSILFYVACYMGSPLGNNAINEKYFFTYLYLC